MKKEDFIKIGETKALIIDFNKLYPSSGLFVTTLMLLEFTHSNQVIPTRLDVLPFKMSPFSKFNKEMS